MKKLYQFKFTNEYFLFLLPVFFVGHIAAQNFPSVSFSDCIYLIFIYEVASIILCLLSFAMLKDRLKAFLLGSFCMFVFLFFGTLQDTLKLSAITAPLAKYSLYLPILLILGFLVFAFLKNTTKNLSKLRGYLNVLLTTLILIDFLSITNQAFALQKQEKKNKYRFYQQKNMPSVYLLILDEYAGKSALRDLFHFDNSDFESQLDKRGFWTFDSSRSNYNYTPYSMASLLSMSYLSNISLKSNDINNRKICYSNIYRNDLIDFFKNNGYKFYNHSLFDFAMQSPVFKNSPYETGRKIVTGSTLLGRINRGLAFHLVTTFHWQWFGENYLNNLRDNISSVYQKTISCSKLKEKKFIYAHFIMPHYPYLFNRSGKQLSFANALQDGNKTFYLEFLQYANQVSLNLIDSIRKHDSNSIIILMSDHGYTKYTTEYPDDYNFRNMIHISLPSKNYYRLPKTLTNVNLFRTILNSEFGQDLPILKDSTFFLKEY